MAADVSAPVSTYSSMSQALRPPIFIVGPHRAGSTLWHNLLAMSPNVMRLTEPRFLGPSRQRDFRFFLQSQARDLRSESDIETMVELCFSRKGVYGLESAFWRFEGIDAANSAEMRREIVSRVRDSDRSIGSIARILLEEVTRFSGYEQAVVKFPVHVGHLPELVEWFPDSKIVHITRDPRGLAMSKTNDPSGTALKVFAHPRLRWPIRKAAILNVIREYRVAAGIHERLESSTNYRLFRYEDLLVDPERVLRELCGFVELEFVPAMLSPERGRHKHQPSSLTGKRQDSFDPAAAVRWRDVISPAENLLVTALTARSMRRMGYDPVNHPIFRQP